MAHRAGVGLSVCGIRSGPSACWPANPGRTEARKPLEAPRDRKLGSFLRSMERDNFVLDYDPDAEDGFYRVDAEPASTRASSVSLVSMTGVTICRSNALRPRG